MLHILDIQRDEVTEGHAEAARGLADKVTFPLQGFLLGGKATLLLSRTSSYYAGDSDLIALYNAQLCGALQESKHKSHVLLCASHAFWLRNPYMNTVPPQLHSTHRSLPPPYSEQRLSYLASLKPSH